MISTGRTIKDLLANVPTISMERTLVRVVADADLHCKRKANFLFTSRKPNRYNPNGVKCLYFAEHQATAEAEFVNGLLDPASIRYPRAMFWAEVKLDIVIDLANSNALSHLGLAQRDLYKDWRLSLSPVRTQLLGEAVAKQRRISAIRYPSDVVRSGSNRYNVVIFKACIAKPDSVTILGPDRKNIQRWP